MFCMCLSIDSAGISFLIQPLKYLLSYLPLCIGQKRLLKLNIPYSQECSATTNFFGSIFSFSCRKKIISLLYKGLDIKPQ